VSDVHVSLALPPEAPLTELVEIGAEAEHAGCNTVWVNDDRLQKDVFTVLAAIAQATHDLRLGPGVTNPYSRHPALLATAIATLDELSGGRAVLGLGAGGTNHRALGVKREAPATALREATMIVRGLLAGECVTVDGKILHAFDAQLDFTPQRSDVPIYIGSRGPKVLEMAGELADGVIVGNVASTQGWSYALDHVEGGCRRAERDPNEVALTAWVACAVSDGDADAAIDAVRPMVATSLTTSRPILHELDIALPDGFASVMERHGWTPSRAAVHEAAPEIPVELVRRFAVAGTAADCRAHVEALLEGVPRLSELAIIPFPVAGQQTLDVVRSFSRDVMPAVVDA
jgi:5,10-methylenetetrahydromethanopterin reductase